MKNVAQLMAHSLEKCQKSIVRLEDAIYLLDYMKQNTKLSPEEVKTLNLCVIGPVKRRLLKEKTKVLFWEDEDAVISWLKSRDQL